jgi:carbonic anhydrase
LRGPVEPGQGLDGAALRSELQLAAGGPPPFEIGAFQDLDADVRASLRRVRQSRFLQHVDRVRGYVYDVGTRRLREVHDR